MKDIIKLLEEPETTIALVGANDNPHKYGCIIYRDLKRKGYNVIPVNPNRPTVDGDMAFPTVTDIPEKPTIVNFVTPPQVTLKVLNECLEVDLKNVWLQPGAENSQVLSFLEENNFNYLANACIMVETGAKAF